MEPHFAKNDKSIFYKYLDRSKNYFEYGSGGSTCQAAKRKNIERIYSVESDMEWHKKLKSQLSADSSKISFIYSEMDTRPNKWGHPGPKCTLQQKKNYSNHILTMNANTQKDIDFILIDGRFRVACCLKCFRITSEHCVIAFDDFLNRPQYREVLRYFDIIEKTKDKRMVILKKKKNVPFPRESTIKFYETIAE